MDTEVISFNVMWKQIISNWISFLLIELVKQILKFLFSTFLTRYKKERLS